MAYYISHDSFISRAGKETYGDKKQDGKGRKCVVSDIKDEETENRKSKQTLKRRDSKKIPQKAVRCEEIRQQELITVEGGQSESLTFCKVNKSLKQTEAASAVEYMDSQSEENTNAEGMKTEIYVKIETVENITLTLRERDRKLATPLCVGEENNDKECIDDYDNSDVRQKGDLFTETIDVNIKKKEVFPEESEMKNIIVENTFENLIEKSHEVSTKDEMTHLDTKVLNEESCDETKQESTNNEKMKVLDNVKDDKVENVGDEYEDLSDIKSSNSSQTNSIHNHQEKESEALIHGQEIEFIADTNEIKETSENKDYNKDDRQENKLDDFKTETNGMDDSEERKEGNGIGETEEPAGKSSFQLESVYSEKATNLFAANENENIADETEDCEIIPNEPKNESVNDNERKEQDESNKDLEIKMYTTNEEIKIHTEEKETITDEINNTECSEVTNEVTKMKKSEEHEDHKSCQENLKNINMEEHDKYKKIENVLGSEEIRNESNQKEAIETMIVYDNSIEEASQLLEVRFMENDILDKSLSGEEENIEESKENLFEENTSKMRVLSKYKDSEQIIIVKHTNNESKDQTKDDYATIITEDIIKESQDTTQKDINEIKVLSKQEDIVEKDDHKNTVSKYQAKDDTILTTIISETEDMIEFTPKHKTETESNATKSINSKAEILLEIDGYNDIRKGAFQTNEYKTYSEETFKDELIFAASIVTEEASDAGHHWKEDKSGKCLENGRNWLKTEGPKARKPHEANQMQSSILSWLPFILSIMIMSYMAMMVIRLVDEKREYANEVSVQMKDDLLDQSAYFDIMKWP